MALALDRPRRHRRRGGLAILVRQPANRKHAQRHHERRTDRTGSNRHLTSWGGEMSRDAYESDRDRSRDDAGVGPYAEKGMSLASLKELGNWDIAEGEADIRGWQVRTISG